MVWSILALAHSEIEITDRNGTNDEGGQVSAGGHWEFDPYERFEMFTLKEHPWNEAGCA